MKNISHNYTNLRPYELSGEIKRDHLLKNLINLNKLHFMSCKTYKNIVRAFGWDNKEFGRLEDLPYIPVRLFKEQHLKSIDESEIFKVLTSSGTSGQKVSRIYLDRDTSASQTKTLSRIMMEVVGSKRLPMLVIDTPSVIKDRNSFSARTAGVLGFSMYGKDVTFALDEEMQLNFSAIEAFLERNQQGPILIFGFTFIIWKYFVLNLQKTKTKLNLSRAILLHGGGWKKLIDQAVSADDFKNTLRLETRIQKVVNYYGMVEQTGSIFVECPKGFLHANSYTDIIVRDFYSLRPLPFNQEGIIQVLSLLPKSYPGHSLLTEDIGVIIGEDNCECGLSGKYFHVNGRLKSAEIRGCSDTHQG